MIHMDTVNLSSPENAKQIEEKCIIIARYILGVPIASLLYIVRIVHTIGVLDYG